MTTQQRPFPDLLKALWRHIGPRRRQQFLLLGALMFAAAFAEVASLSAVVPFLCVITTPDLVMKYPFVVQLMNSFGLTRLQELVLPLTLIFIATALAAGALRLVLLWATTRVAFSTGSDLSVELYRRTLYQPYRIHVTRNTSVILSGIGKVTGAIGTLTQLLLLASAAVMLVSITLALVAISPVVATVSIVACGLCYAIITGVMRRRLDRISARVATEQTRVFKALQEGLGGIRDILLGGTQPIYIEEYRSADLPLRRDQGNNLYIAGAPRFVMEAAGMVLIALIAYGLSLRASGVAAEIPVLGALALGAQRLLPTLQQAYSAWATIYGNRASLADTLDLLDQPLPPDVDGVPLEPMPLKESIRLKDVDFRYAVDAPLVLDGLDLTIPKGAHVGIVGATGAGKSTVLDILMALLEPSGGELLVDGVAITTAARRKAWQRAIGHVPQSIYLADASIAENIAFGVPRAEIEMDRVRQAARQAQLAEFVESRPEGYGAQVGERGIRLSGGQRQRIGIARALYKRASVLVLDEATSALDNVTEQCLMEAIDTLDRNLTIVMIAHRLTTVRRCDTIVELRGGKIVAQGAYIELLARSQSFKQLAGNEA